MATIYEALTPSKLPGARTVISWNPSRITDAMRKCILDRLTNPTKYRGGGWSDLRMVMNYAHHAPGFVAQFVNNVRKR